MRHINRLKFHKDTPIIEQASSLKTMRSVKMELKINILDDLCKTDTPSIP